MKPRKAWGALLLSLTSSPAGFFYVGRAGRGCVIFLSQFGDNRLHSDDSRRTGPVDISNVRGTVRLVWYAQDHARIGTRFD